MGFFSTLLRLLFSKTNSDNSLYKKYIEEEKKLYKYLFDDIDGKSLDDDQRTAVVDDSSRQLVVAGAGSGKTLTISAKVKYLVDVKGISPDEILLISFTKKSADEMHERIQRLGIDIESSTFHKYGLRIITQVEKKQPDVVDDISVYLDKYLSDNVFADDNKAKEFLCLVGLFMIPITSEKSTIGEKIEVEKLQNLRTLRDMAYNSQKRTLRNENVKSAEEVYLANRFFLDGIDYEYEAHYKYDEENNKRKKYRPDFYLKGVDVYWEHFGVDKNNRAPQYDKYQEEKYVQGMDWKRELHYKNNTKLAETFSWQFTENTIDKAIKENYKRFKIEPKPVNYQEIIKHIERNYKNSQFSRIKSLIVTFISLFRSYGYDASYFNTLERDISKNDFVPDKYNVEWKKKACLEFLKLAKGFYDYYINTLSEEGRIDFNDMILKSSAYISKGKYTPTYKYVIIDEFQDISYSRYQLVKETLDVSGAKLFCVGDDWQSIYRFTGADIDIFINFKKYFGSISRTDISKTYRNSQELIDITGRFIEHNKYQLSKKLVSNKHHDTPIRFVKYEGEYKPVIESENTPWAKNIVEAFELALKDIKSTSSESKNNIMALGRMNNDVNLLKENPDIKIQKSSGEVHIIHKNYPEFNIIFRTVHAAKGLEADQVIILNLLHGELGFPSQIIDDPIIGLLQQNIEKCLYAEERRLFYVALTRTKNCTYLLTPVLNESVFASELDHIKRNGEVKNIFRDASTIIECYENTVIQNCPVCKTGILSVKSTLFGKEFVGCSNYPKCDYVMWDVNAVKKNIRCPECGGFLVERKGKYGSFLGCSGYPECYYTKEIDS